MESDWNQRIAEVIASLATPQFMETLVATIRSRVAFDYAVIFAYRGDSRPIDLYDNFPTSKRRVFIPKYQEGPYLLDPFFLACADNVDDGLYRLKHLAADRFYQSEYFRSYYGQTGLSEEIAYLVGLPHETKAVISLMRLENSSTFNAREFRELSAIEPVVRAAGNHQWHNLHTRFDASQSRQAESSIQKSIEHAFHTFGKSILTPRERDIVEYVLKGHSSEAIAKILGITAGTVRIHRKNIYSKLRINSQGELFSQFISGLS
ncbi:MAG: response regulator transcription factor [Granulosicoccus sp.]